VTTSTVSATVVYWVVVVVRVPVTEASASSVTSPPERRWTVPTACTVPWPRMASWPPCSCARAIACSMRWRVQLMSTPAFRSTSWPAFRKPAPATVRVRPALTRMWPEVALNAPTMPLIVTSVPTRCTRPSAFTMAASASSVAGS